MRRRNPSLFRRGPLCWLACAGLGACADTHQISPDGMHAYELSMAVQGEQMAAAWHGGRHRPNAIYLQWLTMRGKPRGALQRITDGLRDAFEADLQLVDGDALLAWYEKDLNGGSLSAWLARVDKTGHVRWRRALNGAGGFARNPVIRVADRIVHVAWIETVGSPHDPATKIWAARYDLNGGMSMAAHPVGEASRTTWNLNAALDRHGVFYVVYDARLDARANELHLLMLDGAQVRQQSLSADDASSSTYPDIGINENDQFALAWFDERDGNREVYLRRGTLTALRDGQRHDDERLTHTRAESIGAYLAWHGGRLAVVWCDAEAGQKELYLQWFPARGPALASPKRLTQTPTQSSIPAIRSWRGGVVLSWNEYSASGRTAGGHGRIAQSRAMWRYEKEAVQPN